MKRLILLLMLASAPAFGQVGPDTYRPATPSQIVSLGTTSVAVTAAFFHRVARLLCDADCYINITPSGQTAVATVATGIFLPADVPHVFSVSPGSKVSVIQEAGGGGGKLHVLELTR